MKRKTLTITAAAAVVALAAAAFAAPSIAHGPGGGPYQGGYGMMGHMGPGMMGGGMMGGGWGAGRMGGAGMMGPGMMGYGPSAHGDCPAAQAAQGKDVTVDGVTKLLEHRLAMWGNDRLKLGEVSEQGEDAIVGEIVTQDGSLVERLVFDRHSGRVTRGE
jgi:hypothetical protein